jgi:hypothetical protein
MTFALGDVEQPMVEISEVQSKHQTGGHNSGRLNVRNIPATLSPSEFISKLKRDELGLPLSLIGLVKGPNDKDKTIQFAVGRKCDNWTTIPVDAIDSVQFLRNTFCRDHSHPLVKLYLNLPKSGDAKMYHSLLLSLSNNSELSGQNITARQCRECGGRVMKKCNVDQDGKIDWNSCVEWCIGCEPLADGPTGWW